MRIHSHFHEAVLALLFTAWVLLTPAAITHAQEGSDGAVTPEVQELTAREQDAPYTITPVVSNEKAKPRDIIKKELVLTNTTAQKVELYLTVEDINPEFGAEEFVGISNADLSTSLASWVEVTRGVIELAPGESRKVPYLIHVNLTAKPGSYFASIRARHGSTRAEAEARDEGAELILNLEVLDDAKERLQLGTFTTDDSVIFGNNVLFSYLLENIGNRDIEPRGSIRIFNRRGEEVGSVPLNADGVEISPDDKEQLATAWSAAGRFGKYKAFLDLEYGENQLASVQDTVYFWVFPWKEILASLAGVLTLAVVGTFIVHMRAVARPRPAYEYAQAPAHQPPQQPPAPTPYMPSRSALHTSGPTSIPPRNGVRVVQTQTRSSSGPVRTSGSRVALAPRHGQRATTEGSTVTLPSRR